MSFVDHKGSATGTDLAHYFHYRFIIVMLSSILHTSCILLWLLPLLLQLSLQSYVENTFEKSTHQEVLDVTTTTTTTTDCRVVVARAHLTVLILILTLALPSVRPRLVLALTTSDMMMAARRPR